MFYLNAHGLIEKWITFENGFYQYVAYFVGLLAFGWIVYGLEKLVFRKKDDKGRSEDI